MIINKYLCLNTFKSMFKYIYIMAHKTITVSLKAYTLLKKRKRSEKESFSEVIIRLLAPKYKSKGITALYGCLKGQTDEWENILQDIYKNREKEHLKSVKV